MKKVLDFFKKVWDKIRDLYIADGRWVNVVFGGAIMVVMSKGTAMLSSCRLLDFKICLSAAITTFIVVLTAEFKDKQYVSQFNWKDVNAGVFVPIVFMLASVMMLLFR